MLSAPHHTYPALDLMVPVGTPVYAITGGRVDRRPPLGPTSVVRSFSPLGGAIQDEFSRMRALFGRAAGGEVGLAGAVGPSDLLPRGARRLA